ncbi:hypothetical protein [Helicobacter vulpis]|uniref:hypothetical protein n=1 Tax=Helicobacter vulpis TaxID=2316076 RepID=UPI000EB12F0E|nr:hypothetical protein [Helicobacter vulpis]
MEIFKENGDPRKRNRYFEYAQKHKPRMVKDKKLVVCKATDLDPLYRIMYEDYYTTEIGGEQRVATVSEKNNVKN